MVDSTSCRVESTAVVLGSLFLVVRIDVEDKVFILQTRLVSVGQARASVLGSCFRVRGKDVGGRMYMLQKWLAHVELAKVAYMQGVCEKT